MEPSLITALVVMLLAMAICAALGVIIERFAYRPVRKYSRLTALITAIGVSLLLENGGQVVFGADPKFFPELFKKRNIELFGGASINSADIIVLVIALALMIGSATDRLPHQDRAGDARRFVQPAVGQADGHQHRSHHHASPLRWVRRWPRRPACWSRFAFRASIR